MDKMKPYVRGLILAPILAVAVFIWILFYDKIGGMTYWSALVAFAIYVASGSNPKKLPWMLIGGLIGTILGLLTFYISMLVFPTFSILSSAIAGAIFLFVAALIGAPKAHERLPMAIVGWAAFIGGMLQYMDLIGSFPVWAIPKTFATFAGVLLSISIGLLFGTLVATPLLGSEKPARARSVTE